jgi:hypothetical protein
VDRPKLGYPSNLQSGSYPNHDYIQCRKCRNKSALYMRQNGRDWIACTVCWMQWPWLNGPQTQVPCEHADTLAWEGVSWCRDCGAVNVVDAVDIATDQWVVPRKGRV